MVVVVDLFDFVVVWWEVVGLVVDVFENGFGCLDKSKWKEIKGFVYWVGWVDSCLCLGFWFFGGL